MFGGSFRAARPDGSSKLEPTSASTGQAINSSSSQQQQQQQQTHQQHIRINDGSRPSYAHSAATIVTAFALVLNPCWVRVSIAVFTAPLEDSAPGHGCPDNSGRGRCPAPVLGSSLDWLRNVHCVSCCGSNWIIGYFSWSGCMFTLLALLLCAGALLPCRERY